MAYVLERKSGRWSGYYRDADGRKLTAGTYDTQDEALAAAEALEVQFRIAAPAGPAEERFADYVAHWLADTDEVTTQTLKGYESIFRRWVLPYLGAYRLGDLTKPIVGAMFKDMRRQQVSPWVMAQAKAAIGCAIRPLVPDVLAVNPAHSHKIDLPPTKPFNLVTVEDFHKIIICLPDPGTRLFATFLATTGCRFGEATEVRLSDLQPRTNEVSIVRRACELGGKANNGERFRVEQGTKAGSAHGRTIVIPSALMSALLDWSAENQLGERELLFPERLIVGDHPERVRILPGERFTVDGKRFRHGTPYAYTAASCRCDDCRGAQRQYRRDLSRRARLQRGNALGVNTTGHLANGTWASIWKQACRESGLGWVPRTHDLRHACATHLVASGVSIYETMSILGHRRIETTLKYQHRVDAMRSKAVEAVSAFL